MFDLDGTLIDSMGDIITSANILLERRKRKPLMAKEVRAGIGKGVHFLVSHVLREGGASRDDLEAAATVLTPRHLPLPGRIHQASTIEGRDTNSTATHQTGRRAEVA